MQKKINYLNNKDMLREIHKSKSRFCYFLKPEYANYDAILNSKNDITPKFLSDLVENIANPKGKTPPRIVTPEDLVIRVMTHEHIPLDPNRKRKDRNTEENHARTNFKPFKHYKMMNGELVEVGRSHWKGNLETGHFSTDHVTITDNLALMLMKLVERYASRWNWRGYSYNDEMIGSALTHLVIVALQFDESVGAILGKPQNPFAFYTTATLNCFRRTLQLEKRAQGIRDDLLSMAGATPSITRQISHEIDAMFPTQVAVIEAPKKRGPVPKAKRVEPPKHAPIGHNNPPD